MHRRSPPPRSPTRGAPPPAALTVAGSDSGGGAGVQADLKTFHQWGVYGTSALTAVTAQNTLGVQRVHPVPARLVAAQLGSVADDFPVLAVKSGMLASAETVRTLATALRERTLGDYVLDPVMVATSGDRLLDSEAVDAIVNELVPLATLVTPNWAEAAILTGVEDASLAGMERAARLLVDAGAGAALVKGGHSTEAEVADVFWNGHTIRVLRGPRVPTRHTHGTGCTLSAAVAAGLALGRRLPEAVEAAVEWVRRAIADAPGLGAGHGPINHFAPATAHSGSQRTGNGGTGRTSRTTCQ